MKRATDRRTLRTKLVRHRGEVALLITPAMMRHMGITRDDPVHYDTDGKRLILAPSEAELRRGMRRAARLGKRCGHQAR